MFRIPSFYKFDTSFEDAKAVMTSYCNGDLLEGMEAMNRVWDEHCASYDSDNARFEDDSDFYEFYEAEVNAYNKVFETMKPLFVNGEAA
jgi:hypothetical protein